MQSSSLIRDPSTYSLLPLFTTNAFSIPGLQQWTGTFVSTGNDDLLSAVGINATGSLQQVSSISWPDRVMRVHPLFDKLVVVGWRSPINGLVDVAGSFAKLDPGGNGVLWFIDQDTTDIAQGDLPPNGTGNFQLSHVTVTEGSFLYFVVDPKNGNFDSDSTGLQIYITAVPEPAALALLGIGALGVIGYRWRRRKELPNSDNNAVILSSSSS